MNTSLGSHPTTMARYARRPAGPRRPRGPWKHGPIPVLGLIGGIGAGKSLVAAELATRGALVLDADAVGHALLEQRPARDLVLARFGREILGPDGAIDRKALGAIVFEHPSARHDLEAILHPRMRRTFERAIDRAVRKGDATAVVLDAAILYEAGWDDLCDRVAFVEAPAEVRLARVAAQRGWDAETLEGRERAQLPLEVKRGRGKLVIRNDAGSEELRAEVDALWARLVPPPRPRPDHRRPSAGRDDSSPDRILPLPPGNDPSHALSAKPNQAPAAPEAPPPTACRVPGDRPDEES